MAEPFESKGFLSNDEAGHLVSATSDHCVAFPDELPLWIQQAVETFHPDEGGGAVVYKIGESFGERAAVIMVRALAAETRDLGELTPDRFSAVLARVTAAFGWGRLTLVPSEDWLFVDLHGSVMQRILGGTALGKPSHGLYAGFIGGLLGKVGGKPVTVVEAVGQGQDGAIRFRVHPAEDMDGAEFWGQYAARMPELTFAIRDAARRHGGMP